MLWDCFLLRYPPRRARDSFVQEGIELLLAGKEDTDAGITLEQVGGVKHQIFRIGPGDEEVVASMAVEERVADESYV